MQPVIEAREISKSFGTVKALQDVSFSVEEGEVFGLIGPDGAGKTTLFRIITTLLLPDSGIMTVMRKEITTSFKDIRKKIGYMPGRFSLYQDLSVEENLEFYATVFGTTIKENYDLISDIYSHIEPFRKRLAGKLSGGMKQKLALSCALIHKPELLVLDEPTTGVDAVSRAEFWTMLSKLRKHGISIIVSTPYMDEAMRCDRIALIQSGKILSVDTPEGICKSFSRKMFIVRAADKYRLLTALRNYQGTLTAYPFGDSVHLTTKNDNAGEELHKHLTRYGIINPVVEESVAGIEDRFLELMEGNSQSDMIMKQ